LNDAGVDYVIVGGIAVVLHGVDRLTADLDVVLDLQRDAALKAMKSLEQLGYRPRPPVRMEEFAEPERRQQWMETRNMQVFSLWDPHGELPVLDLFVSYPLDFQGLLEHSVEVDVGGLKTRIASIGHLIEMKSGTNRDKDEQDIAALRERNGR
jgi:hypothetical protein